MVVRLVAPLILTGALALLPAYDCTAPPCGDRETVQPPAAQDPEHGPLQDVDPADLEAHLLAVPR